MVVPRFVRQAVRNRPLTVCGDGQQTRCFCRISDVVQAILALADEPAAEETCSTSAARRSDHQALARRTIALAGSSSSIVRVPYEEAYEVGFETASASRPTKIRRLVG